MGEPYGVAAGQWVRFSDYEIKRGYLVPTKEAVLEPYDPWDMYRASRETRRDGGPKRRESPPPYVSLCSLIENLEFTVDIIDDLSSGYWPCAIGGTPEPGWDGDAYDVLTVKSQQALLDWCRDYGLLGLLPHQAHQITLAPFACVKPWADTKVEDDVFVRDDNSRTLVLYSMSYQRSGSTWAPSVGPEFEYPDATIPGLIDRWVAEGVLTLTPADSGSYDLPASLPGRSRRLSGVRGLLDQPFLSGRVPSHYLGALPQGPLLAPRPAGVVWEHALGYDWRTSPLDADWRRYFPSVPQDEAETFRYPIPLGNEFWHIYAEPVYQFVDLAREFRTMLQRLRMVPEDPDCRLISGSQAPHGLGTLNSLLGSCSPQGLVGPSTSSFRQIWRFPSLLGSFAMMVLQDLTEGRQVLTCESCGDLFLSSAYQARFCSARCRHKEQKRRQRAGRELE